MRRPGSPSSSPAAEPTAGRGNTAASHFRWDGPDLLLALRGKPGARRDAFLRVQGDRLVVQIAAVAEDGKATAHLLAVLAKAFDVPRSAVTLVYGETSPNKQVRIASPRRLPPGAEVLPPRGTGAVAPARRG